MDRFEIVVAITIIFGLFYIYFLKGILRRYEPFDPAGGIPQRLANIDRKHVPSVVGLKPEPRGVGSTFAEGFADAGNGEKKGDEATEKSATAPKLKEDEVKLPKELVHNVTSANEKKDDKDEKVADGFQSASGALFKLGQMPSETKDGPWVDGGSTLLKAMDALKPEQISSMTEDTRQLIDTQKNLMSMLGQMKPVLADGKQLLDTFSKMFGGFGGGGAATGAAGLFKLG
jgi:hypothetical protein